MLLHPREMIASEKKKWKHHLYLPPCRRVSGISTGLGKSTAGIFGQKVDLQFLEEGQSQGKPKLVVFVLD